MKRIDANQLKGKGGFTLVELIVVLILMSMLAAVAVPSYLGFVDDNKAKECAKNREMLAAYVDEIRVTDSDAGMEDAIKAHPEIACPSGGTYQVKGKNNTVYCDHEGHDGETTVILKSASVVQADVDKVQTEAATNPPEPENGGGGGGSEPVVPTLSYSVNPTSLEMEVEGESKTLTVVDTQSTYCKVNGYNWTLEPEGSGIVQLTGNNGTATVMPLAEGTCTIHCQAYVTVDPDAGDNIPENNGVNVQVTVNEKKLASVSVSPKEITIEEGETYYSVNATPQNCSPSSFEWTSNNSSTAITNGNRNSCSITGNQEGTCAVTCKMGYYPDGSGIVQYAEDTLTVHVTKKAVPSGDLFVDLPNPLRINGGTGQDMKKYLTPGVEGQWSVVEGPVITSENSNYIGSTGNPGNFKLKFTASDGREQTIEGIVVYPHTSFGINPRENFSMILDEEKDITGEITAYELDDNGGETTDGPVIWENDSANPGVVSLTWSGDKDRIAHVKALKVGSATITAKLQNGYDDTWTECTVTITVESKKVASISATDLSVQEDGTAQIQVSYEPATGIDLSKVSLSYACYSELVTVSDTGLVTGINDGTCEVTVTATGDGVEKNNRAATCTVTVTDNPKRIKKIWVEPNPISLELGQSAQPINTQYEPDDAETADVRYTYESYEGSLIDVSENGMVTPKAEGETEITIKAYKGSIYLAECKVKVSVIDPNKLTGISLSTEHYELKNGEEATIALSPGSGQITVFPVPETADMSGAEILLEYYESVVEVSKIDAASWKIKGKNVGKAYIKVKAHQGNIWVEKTLEVNVIDNPEKLSGILVQPSEIDIMEGEQKSVAIKLTDESSGDVLVSPIPNTANLEGAELSSFTYNNNISVTDNVITGRYASNSWDNIQVNITVKKGEDTFTGNLKVNVKQDPTRLQSFWIDSMSLEVNEEHAVVMHLQPEKPEMKGVTFTYTSENPLIATVSAEGVVTGYSSGTTSIKTEAYLDGIKLAENTFNVTVLSSEVEVDGLKLQCSTWSSLKDYLRAKTNGSVVDFPEKDLYRVYYDQYNWRVYILKTNNDLVWDDSYESMTFKEFYEQNKENFIEVPLYHYSKKNEIPVYSVGEWYNEKDVVSKDGKYYVCLQSGKEGNFEERFREINVQ